MKRTHFFILLFLTTYFVNSQNDLKEIKETITNYFEGTANGEPEKLKQAFHPDFNLYTISKDSLRIRSGKKYIDGVKEGQKANRIGKILSIDCEDNVAMAKAEVIVPNKRIFTDYFLLLKYKGSWKIVHKSYTSRPYEKTKG